MHIAKQLAIFLENRPGMLARVCDALAAEGINIYALSTSDTIDHAVIRMVVSDYRRALHVFEQRGTLVVEDDVLLVEGSNRPGSLAQIAHKLAHARINIEYAYCATPPEAKKGLLVLRVKDVKKALKVLNG
ncbi:MAG: ACT domain-containing protein [Verrucomicrobiales bacterium]|nr:ACT domain-containing protein [Verrucomicrobiales bacterium]